MPFDLIVVKFNIDQGAKRNNENTSHSQQTLEKVGNDLSTANHTNSFIITGCPVDSGNWLLGLRTVADKETKYLGRNGVSNGTI